MDEQKLVPKLRFPGFTDPWEQRKLGEVFDERNEKGEQGELLSVTIGAGVVRTEDLERAVNTSDDRYNYKVVKKGDLIYNTMRMWQGACGSSLYTGIVSPAYTVLVPLAGNSSKFFAHYFKRKDLLYLFKRYSQGLTSDTWNLKFNVLKEIKICVPLIEEQYKIADFLEAYDSNLTLHQRKLEHLKLKKKSLLQKLFPREGELYPELRFPGFTDPWEQRKLGEIYKRVNERNDGTLGRDKWISVAKMYFQDPEKVQSNNLDTRTYVMKKGDIAFEGHPNNEFKFGRFVLNDIGTGIISELFPIYRPIVKYDLEFWKYAIQLERIMAPIFSKSITSSGNSSNKLDQNHFLNQMISIPTIDEQKKIGLILKTITNLITLHQRKLEHLQLLKKALLQQLFV